MNRMIDGTADRSITSQHKSSNNFKEMENSDTSKRRDSSDLTPINTSDHASTLSQEVAATEKSRKLREVMAAQREANIITALRLIRQVSKPAPNPVVMTEPQIRTTKKRKKKDNPTASDRQLSLLRTFGNEEHLVLHDIKDMHREAYASFHRRSKASTLSKVEDTDGSSAILKARRPQSANIIAEIVAEERAKAKERQRAQREKQRRQEAMKSAWESMNSLGELDVGQFSSVLDEAEVQRRHPMLPDSLASGSAFSVEAGGGLPVPVDAQRPHTSDGLTRRGAETAERQLTQYRPKVRRCSPGVEKKSDNRGYISPTIPRRPNPKPQEVKNMKERLEMRTAAADLKCRRQRWLKLVALLSRSSQMAEAIENKRKARLKGAVFKMQRSAVRRLELFWKSHRISSTMRKNQHATDIVRTAVLNFVRKKKVGVRRFCTKLIATFIHDISGVSERTQKLYRFRARVIRIQRWVRGFIACQPARLLVLWLALERELVKARAVRNRQLSESERRSIRKMKNTVYFGPTVQKLDDVCTSLSSLMTSKAQTYKTLMQKQRHIENLSASRPAGGRRHAQTNSRSISRKYMVLLRKVLKMQRKRHIVSEDTDKKVHTKTQERQAVDDNDVKAFLITPNHSGPSFILQSVEESWQRKPSQFLLLTGGALREIESVSYGIVMSEEGSKRGGSAGDNRSYLSGMSSFASGDEHRTDFRDDRLHSPDDDFMFDDDDEW